jgi:VIT1/CCC1 family predicted Fe2+/Mn2+ transporter
MDELLDLTLYKRVRPHASPDLQSMLDQLIPVETRHFEFWKAFFGLPVDRLDFGRRLKLSLLSGVCRLFGDQAILLVLEGIEVHGIRKYLQVWESAKGLPLGDAVRKILEDEMSHEDAIVTKGASSRLDPEKVRSLFLGFNDGCVEILGAVSGFTAAFRDSGHVLMAAASVAVAGALSMAAGSFAAVGSEREAAAVEAGKRRFLDPAAPEAPAVGSPAAAALLVGGSYFVGATVPVLPLLLGGRGLVYTVLSAGAAILVVSTALSFLSGIDIRRRILTNLVVIAAAVGVSEVIGLAARRMWGISL